MHCSLSFACQIGKECMDENGVAMRMDVAMQTEALKLQRTGNCFSMGGHSLVSGLLVNMKQCY